jgi:O-antigen/teichoic acid export membrane protein
MSEIVNSSLKSATKGTLLVFAGMVASFILWFVAKLLLVRITTKEELGIYSLTLAVISICVLLSNLGLPEGVSRYISIYLGENRKDYADGISKDALRIGALSGMLIFAVVVFSSGLMSKYIFYKPELEVPLKVMSFIIPFSVITNITNGILRGHNIIFPKVCMDVGQPFLFLVFLGLFVVLRLSFINIIYAFVLATALIFLATVVYVFNKLRLSIKESALSKKSELLRFSIPLLASSVMAIVLGWTDTLMLGRYANAADVGVYNVSMSLARLLTFPLGAISFVFMPIAAEMFARKQNIEIRRTYQVLTKWVFSVTLPVFFVLFFFPEMTITFLFGGGFTDASASLRILSVCFLMNALSGTNGVLLLVMGMSRTIMQISFFGVLVNVGFNYILIKRLGYGVIGASFATLLSYIALNILTSWFLYRQSGIHPITAKYIKPVIGAAIVGTIIYILAKILPLYFWMMPVYLFLFLSGYALSIILAKSIDKEDLVMLERIFEKLGFSSKLTIKVLERFVG